MKQTTRLKLENIIRRLIKEDIQQIADEINSAVRSAKSGDIEGAASIYSQLPHSYKKRLQSAFERIGKWKKIEQFLNDDDEWTDPAGGTHGRFTLDPSNKYK